MVTDSASGDARPAGDNGWAHVGLPASHPDAKFDAYGNRLKMGPPKPEPAADKPYGLNEWLPTTTPAEPFFGVDPLALPAAGHPCYEPDDPPDADLVAFVRDLARLARAEGIAELTVDGITLTMGPPLPKPASAADYLEEADDDEEQRTRFRERDTSRKYAATPIRPRRRPQPPRVGD